MCVHITRIVNGQLSLPAGLQTKEQPVVITLLLVLKTSACIGGGLYGIVCPESVFVS